MADVVGARCPLANEAAVRVALTLFENAPPLSDAHVDRTRGPCTSRWPRQVRGDGSMTVHEAAYSAFTAYWGVAPQRIGSALRCGLTHLRASHAAFGLPSPLMSATAESATSTYLLLLLTTQALARGEPRP